MLIACGYAKKTFPALENDTPDGMMLSYCYLLTLSPEDILQNIIVEGSLQEYEHEVYNYLQLISSLLSSTLPHANEIFRKVIADHQITDLFRSVTGTLLLPLVHVVSFPLSQS